MSLQHPATRFVPLFACLIVLIAAKGSARAAQRAEAAAQTKPAAGLPEPGADGFIELFNGKDLTGWEGLEGFWKVEDGAIVGAETKEHAAPQTFLVLAASRAEPARFRDFELRFKWKFATPDGNSGVQFRSKMVEPKTFRVGGYQADFDAKRHYAGSIYDEAGVAGGRGTMSNRGERTVWTAENQRKATPLPEDEKQLQGWVKPEDWNDATVVCRGDHIAFAVNGHVMTQLTDESPKAPRDGLIALQLHAGFVMEVRFKDIRMKFLRGQEVNGQL